MSGSDGSRYLKPRPSSPRFRTTPDPEIRPNWGRGLRTRGLGTSSERDKRSRERQITTSAHPYNQLGHSQRYAGREEWVCFVPVKLEKAASEPVRSYGSGSERTQ
jgi:hypothetical protein